MFDVSFFLSLLFFEVTLWKWRKGCERGTSHHHLTRIECQGLGISKWGMPCLIDKHKPLNKEQPHRASISYSDTSLFISGQVKRYQIPRKVIYNARKDKPDKLPDFFFTAIKRRWFSGSLCCYLWNSTLIGSLLMEPNSDWVIAYGTLLWLGRVQPSVLVPSKPLKKMMMKLTNTGVLIYHSRSEDLDKPEELDMLHHCKSIIWTTESGLLHLVFPVNIFKVWSRTHRWATNGPV